MRSREKHLRPSRLFADIHDVCADAVAGVEVFAGYRLFPAQHRLGAAEVDDDVAEFDTFHQAIDDVADPVLELVVLATALRLAYLIDNDLFGCLRGNSPEIDGRQRIDDEFTEIDRRLSAASSLERHLRRLILHCFHDLYVPRERDLPRAAVDVRADIMIVAILGSTGFLDGLFHCLEHFVPVDALVAGHCIRNVQQFRTRVNSAGFHRHFVHCVGDVLRLSAQPIPAHYGYPGDKSWVGTSLAR